MTEAERNLKDLAMLMRRVLASKRVTMPDEMRSTITSFLVRKNLMGSVLRDDAV